MRSTFSAFLLFLISLPAIGQDGFRARVVHVSDGDTITVESPGHIFKVRLFGIDCPEKDQPDGAQATGFTTIKALGRTVEVIPYDKDRYGRMVADIVLPNGQVLNRELLKAGHAWWFERYAPGAIELQQLEAEAREHHRGLWSASSNPLPPWEWRKAGRELHARQRISAR